MPCAFCEKNIPSLPKASHDYETCPFRLSITCLKCCLKGHLASDCTIEMNWKRPACIEELIPEEDRKRWRIQTRTPILHRPLYISHDLATADKEIGKADTYRIIDHDKKIRAFMKENKIHSTHEKVENQRKIIDWAIRRGERIEFVKETIA